MHPLDAAREETNHLASVVEQLVRRLAKLQDQNQVLSQQLAASQQQVHAQDVELTVLQGQLKNFILATETQTLLSAPDFKLQLDTLITEIDACLKRLGG